MSRRSRGTDRCRWSLCGHPPRKGLAGDTGKHVEQKHADHKDRGGTPDDVLGLGRTLAVDFVDVHGERLAGTEDVPRACGARKVEGEEIACAIMDFEYMGGSMGSVVGEKVTRMMEKALALKLPMIAVTSSGGARMQESALSLMQMAKTSCAVGRLDEAGILYINILTEPTFGGITASFGTLGDIIVAEQGARIGFAGRRVIEQTIRQKLPSDFQTAEYLLKYGQVDIVSKRKNLRKTLANILDMHGV